MKSRKIHRKRRRSRRARHPARYFLFLFPAAAALLLYWILPRFPAFTETVFARGIFRIVGTPIGWLTSRLPFSLTEILVLAALPAVVLLLVLFFRSMRRSRSRLQTIGRAVRRIGWFLSCALLLYMLLHGLNAYRQPIPKLMGLDTSAKSAEYLEKVTADLARKASAQREKTAVDKDGCMKLSESLSATLGEAGDGYRVLDKQYPFLWGTVNRAKPVLLSHWWSYTGITGMYFPFFVEANVNIDQPASDIPVAASHDLAHTRGFAREDEANFFACLSCFDSPSADYRYSGYLMAYTYCANALYNYSPALWKKASANCSQGVWKDIDRSNGYWKAFEGKVQKASTAVNNKFIQSQGVKDGVLSYDRVVELLLAYYQKQGWVK